MTLERTADFRPIQYLGNKSRLLDQVEDVLATVAPDAAPVCDLFAGTGVVARRLARTRRVLAADIQEYSRVLTASLLAPRADLGALLAIADQQNRTVSALAELAEYEELAIEDSLAGDPEALCDVIEAGTILRHASRGGPDDSSLGKRLRKAAESVPSGPSTVLTRYYGGLYFSFRQALELDALASAARSTSGPLRDVAIAAVMATASEVVSTVGNQFAQPVQPRKKDGSVKRPVLRTVARQRCANVFEVYRRFAEKFASLDAVGPGPHRVVRADFRELLAEPPQEIGVIYADPPYTRDHYSRFYHVLETIAVGDEPDVSEVVSAGVRSPSRALYRADRHQSPFCIRTQAPAAFSALFEGARDLGVPLVLSYSPYSSGTAARPAPRVETIEGLVGMASKYFTQVEVRTGGDVVVHSRLNRDELSRDVDHSAEVFIVAAR